MNWRDKWQHRTRGGYEVVNVYMLHGLLRVSINLESGRHPGYAVDENGKAISHSHKYDLLPITPPNEPAQVGDTLSKGFLAAADIEANTPISVMPVDYRDCLELAGKLAECIEKADGSWCYEGDDLPGQFISVLKPVLADLAGLRRDAERWRKLRAAGTRKQFGPYIVIRTEDARLGTQAFTEQRLDEAVDAMPDLATCSTEE